MVPPHAQVDDDESSLVTDAAPHHQESGGGVDCPLCKTQQRNHPATSKSTSAVVSPDEAEDVACEGSIGEAVVGGYGLGVIGGRRRSNSLRHHRRRGDERLERSGGGGGGTMGGVRKGSR